MVLSIQQRVTTPPIAAVNADAKTSSASSVQEQVDVRSNVVANSQKMHQDLQKSLEQVNQLMKDSNRNLSFSMDHALGRLVVVVRKEDTGEVIRQIPNEAIVSVAHNIELLKGILLNRRT